MLQILEPEIRVLKTKESPKREPITKEKITERGTYSKSTITLCNLRYEERKQISVFIHPADYELNDNKINSLDAHFTNVRIVRSRSFNKASLEDVESAFLRAAKPSISFMSHDYTSHAPPIKEHSFVKESEVYLEGIISDLKV